MSWVGPAIQAGGAVLGGVAGGKGGKSSKPPKWLRQDVKSLGQFGQQLGQTQYSPFEGQRVAPFSQDTLNAFDLIRGSVGTTQPYYANAMGTAERLQNTTISPQQVQAAQFAGTNLSPYLNPYTNEVVNASLGDLENQRAVQYNNLASQAQAAGAFGGSRFGVAQGQFEADALRDKGLLAAQLRNQGFNTAANLAMQDVASQNAALFANQQADFQGQVATADIQNRNAFLQGVLAQNLQGANAADAQALAGAGSAQQALAQQQMDVGYNNYLDQRNWPSQQLNWWNAALQPGVAVGTAMAGAPSSGGGGLLGAIGGAQLGSQLGSSIYDWWKTPPPYSSYDITSEYSKG